jgi:hypothetical protein
MPKAKKTTEAGVSSPATEPKRKRTKTMPKVAVDAPAQPVAVSHKHAAKKAYEPVEQQVPNAPRPVAQDDIAKLAYSYWEARGFQGGSPQEDWLRAERELLIAPQNR